MSGKSSDVVLNVRKPRETTALFGHEEAESALLTAYRSGRFPHAWLIGGAKGTGKASLAYRLARFILANPDASAASTQAASTLELSASHPVACQVAGNSHGGLLVLERSANEKGVMRTVITVDETRETISFFGSTAAVDGWRVCIVDTVDELNTNASNALLKILEEPPERALFLLISHAPARVLPTIRSRCRRLLLRPLTVENVIRAAAAAADLDESHQSLIEAAEESEGSVARALMLMGGGALGLHQRTASILKTLPHVDGRALHALGDALSSNDRTAMTIFIDTIDRWMSERLKASDVNANLPRLAQLAEVWEKINCTARETESFNLERKPLVFLVFGLLADVTR